MKPYIHAKISAKKFGGAPNDYLAIHDFLDSSKATYPDMKHRAILHNAFGCYIAERIFGTTLTNSEGKVVSVRDVAEEHIMEDLGFIPTVEKWLQNLPRENWMHGSRKRLKDDERVD